MSNPHTVLTRIFTLGVIVSVVFLVSGTANATTRFVITGDTRGSDNGVNTTILGEIAQATIDEVADFIVVTGDLVNGHRDDQAGFESQLTTWRDTMQPVYNAGIGVYPLRGNHDAEGVKPAVDPTGALSKAGWDNIFTGSYSLPGNGPSGEENITFSFTHENTFMVVLDQYGTHSNRVNQNWLDSQFVSNTQPHVFVFGHAPAFKVFHSGCLDDYPTERNNFWDSIALECGRIYFASHDHLYNHARIDDGDGDADNDLHQYIVGTGGALHYNWSGSYDGDNGSWIPKKVYHEKEYGYVLVEVNGLDVTLTWKHRTAPGVYETGGDEFTYTYDSDADGLGDTCDNCPNDPENDSDSDDICGNVDNCPDTHNPDQTDTDGDCIGDACADLPFDYDPSQPDTDSDMVGDICDNCPGDYNPDQEDTYPLQGNNIGDACECEADFNCDGNVDAIDVDSFLIDFGRSTFFNPCTNQDPCNGDFDCNVNVDADDVTKFLEDFGRSQFFNPCPACVVGDWCVYP